MITPQEIEEKIFKKSMRGFNCEEVDEFLDDLRVDYENLIRENDSLKERLRMYGDQLNKYTNIEDTLKETLITAQTAAEDTTSAANKKAKIIVEEAEFIAKQKIDEANSRVLEIRKEYDNITAEFKIFKNKFKSLLENEIKNIDEICSNIDTGLASQFEWRTVMNSYGEEEIPNRNYEINYSEEQEINDNEIEESKEKDNTSPESIFGM
ncbi:DivIVA domain-containing protein [Peptacetobacter sp.]|uniref:DivIVA domain-containing protein n=1 Tax=Peptacetobacter sp. TaxID=2991975 RepID=UPI00262BA82C|nr:DivIVA domain-containing protein [Peptacetobacter sp.]